MDHEPCIDYDSYGKTSIVNSLICLPSRDSFNLFTSLRRKKAWRKYLQLHKNQNLDCRSNSFIIFTNTWLSEKLLKEDLPKLWKELLNFLFYTVKVSTSQFYSNIQLFLKQSFTLEYKLNSLLYQSIPKLICLACKTHRLEPLFIFFFP